jgi:hypothetical protein
MHAGTVRKQRALSNSLDWFSRGFFVYDHDHDHDDDDGSAGTQIADRQIGGRAGSVYINTFIQANQYKDRIPSSQHL